VLKTMHLFAGIGGGLLSDLILGHNPVVAVEWDKYACRILRERAADGWFPDLSVWEGDVRLFDPSEYTGRVDIIAAGFPCQDISVAGKQAGLGEGTRSGLYREVLRIAGVVRPRYLFLENVSAILSNWLGTVLGDLAALGYDARWLCIRASDVGAPHGRDRWFCLAELANSRCSRVHQQRGLDGISEKMRIIRGNERDGIQGCTHQENEYMGYPEHNGQSATKICGSIEAGSDDNQTWTQQTEQPTGSSEQQTELANTELCRCLYGQTQIKPTEAGFHAQRESVSSGEDVADTDVQHGKWWGESQQPASFSREARDKSVGSCCAGNVPAPICKQREREGLDEIKPDMGRLADGHSDDLVQGWWEIEPNVSRVTNETKDRANMLKGLGNAQVPLQAAVAWRLLMGKE